MAELITLRFTELKQTASLNEVPTYYHQGCAPPMDLSPFPAIAWDPGVHLGWAALVMKNGYEIHLGELDSLHLRLVPPSDFHIIERPPIAARRAMDRWPYYSAGWLAHSIWPQEPVWQDASLLGGPAKMWVSLPRGSGVSEHAKDALRHLVYWYAMREKG